MAEHIPTTDEMRDIYTWDRCVKHGRDDALDTRTFRAEFDAWLAARDREVAARALEKAADVFEWARDDENYAAFQGWLRDRAVEMRAALTTEETKP